MIKIFLKFLLTNPFVENQSKPQCCSGTTLSQPFLNLKNMDVSIEAERHHRRSRMAAAC